MDLVFDGFDWDEGNSAKCESHGVPIAEIEAVFRTGPRVPADIAHSVDEQRLVAIGRTGAGRPIFVAFTLRGRDGRRLIRPVSARYMHLREIRRYEAPGS